MNYKKKTFTLISLATVLVAASAILQAGPAPKETADGKFHVVYLVSAVDLKPASKVTVDPVFLSDGREVKHFGTYCGNEAVNVVAASERGLLDNYCAKKPFTLDTQGYFALNNHGQQVVLNTTAKFTIVGETHHFERPEEKDPVILGHSTIQSFVPGTIEPPKWLRGDGAPEYFFFMSKDKAVLEKIVPVTKATPAEVSALAKRAEEFSKIAKGRIAGNFLNARDIDKAPICYAPNPMTEFRLENPLIIDSDQDGKADLFVNVYSVHKLKSEPDKPLVACFTKYAIYGNGETYLFGNHQEPLTQWSSLNHSGKHYLQLVSNGYAPQTFMAMVRLYVDERMCTFGFFYLVTSGMPHPLGYRISPMSTGCGYGYSYVKQKPPFDDVQ